MAFSFIGLLFIALVIGLLLSPRTRMAGLFILGLIAVGVLFSSLRVSSRHIQPPPLAINTYPDNSLIEHQRLAVEAQARMVDLQARAAAEILKNQRLTAQMPDAVVQISPDGDRLETYPDGMQIREGYRSGRRTLIREADRPPARQAIVESAQLRTDVAIWLLGAPLAVVAGAYLVVRMRKSNGGWPAAVLTILGCAVALLFGMALLGTRPTIITGDEMTVESVPLSVRPDAAAGAEFLSVPGVDGDQLARAGSPAAIETLWDKLTKPRIELDSPQPATVSPTEAEVAQAAKIILAASAPIADPFTQGWLVNAAKAMLQAVPRADEKNGDAEDDGASLSLAEAMVEPIDELAKQQQAERAALAEYPAIQPYIYDDPSADEGGLRLKQIDGPRPDWIDDPPQHVGNAQRIAVSSDPFTTADECRSQLKKKVEAVVETRLGELARQANSGQHVHVPELPWLGIGPEYIAAELCSQGEYVETISTSVGPMTRVHTLVEFTPSQEQFLLDRWLGYVRMENLGIIAGMSSLAVAGLALVYGLLKVDTWTRGYYTKRLFLGVPAAIIAVFFLSANIFGW